MNSPSLSEYLNAADNVLGIQSGSLKSNTMYDPPSLHLSLVTSDLDPSAGFGAALYKTNANQYIVAFSATSITALPAVANYVQSGGDLQATLGLMAADRYSVGTIYDGSTFSENQFPTQLGDDIDNVMNAVTGAAKQNNIPTGDIYVAGDSLGGVDAEYAMHKFSSLIGGGAAFNATGLPQYSAPTDPKEGSYNFTTYLTYGDPVSNWASDAPGGEILGLTNQDHFGNVVWIGDGLNELGLCVGYKDNLIGIKNTQTSDVGLPLEGFGNFDNLFSGKNVVTNYFMQLHGDPAPDLEKEGYVIGG
jgi:hypothetical protein